MGQINIVLTWPIEYEGKRQIQAVSPDIKLKDAAALAEAERNGDFSSKEKLDAILADAEILNGFFPPKNVLARAPKLKWINSLLAGVDHTIYSDVLKSPVIVTNTRGIHGTQISELVFEKMLMFAKQAPLCSQMKQERKWERFTPMVLHSKTIGIVGLGSIGREIARFAKAFHMRVIATRRSTKKVTSTRYVDKMLPKDKLNELLAESDFVVLAVPATPETDKFIGEAELRIMKPTAYIINIARGSVIDEEALIRALEEKWIAGAGLDAFAKEPLPPQSQLWEFPNMLYTPHIGGVIEHYTVVANKPFCENLKRYLSGKGLSGIVSKTKGY